MSDYSSADVAARGCLERLLSSFPGRTERPLVSNLYEPTGYPLIGLEVEVKWSAFFPELYDRFLSNGRTYQDLSGIDSLELTRLTTKRERELDIHHKLETAVACGMMKGRDCYWEHVFPPTTEPDVMCNIIDVLKSNGMLPNGTHSMQLTVGTVKATRTLYFGLLVLELRAADTARIMSAFHPIEPVKPYSWGKKGRAGIFVKVDWDLKHEDTACELRTLQLDTTKSMAHTQQTLHLAYKTMKGVADIQAGNPTSQAIALHAFIKAAEIQLAAFDLPNENWEKPNQRPDIWRRFAEVLPKIKLNLTEELAAIYSS
jgi:hypothetical protein